MSNPAPQERYRVSRHRVTCSECKSKDVYRYILSLSKNENIIYEKNKTKQNKKTKKQKKKKFSDGESRTLDHQRDKWTRYLLRHNS